MRDLFKSGSVSQFIVHGNIFDVIPVVDRDVIPVVDRDVVPIGDREPRLLSVPAFLERVMFEGYDVVIHYERGRGLRVAKGSDEWNQWLDEGLGKETNRLQFLRDPGSALELIDRYIFRALNLAAIRKNEATIPKIAVVIELAEFVVPRGDPVDLGGTLGSNVLKVLGWANDPAVRQSNIVTVLVAEGLHDLNTLIVENPHVATLEVPLPGEDEMRHYLQVLATSSLPDLPKRSELPLEIVAKRLTGVSRVSARKILSVPVVHGRTISADWLAKLKRESIEKECQGLLDFLESPFTLDHVAGHDAVKAWLRQDTQLLRRGAVHSLPMGYLITGRIGTGKTFLVQCWAGELGLPCVVFKNFRDRWVGATESNLEKIFSILKALGQVVVFVDEADQATGRRGGGDGDGGDGGLSGRVYSMLAKEMSDTSNRGRIIWVFATSRPDLVEVDLKRQGRLDVHIPLFPPQTPDEVRKLFLAVAKKLKFPLAEQDLPQMPEAVVLGGNEIEGILVRALRTYELTDPKPQLRDVLAAVVQDVRPNAHTRKLEYMDMVAVKECTDTRFLPASYRALSPEQIEARLDELRRFVM
jgi:AAA+ superfamily predicted ATPase